MCYSGDGSSMYSIQSLWTAANHKLPLTFVIVNNGGYRIIKQRLLAFHGDEQLCRHGFHRSAGGFYRRGEIARAGGDQGSPIPAQLKSVLSSAFSRPGAKLIEVVVSNSVN